MISIVPSDQAFKSAFSTARVSKAQLARYYLRALQLKADGQTEPQYVPNDDATDVNLEHILPQSPSAEWPGLDEDTARAFVHRLGNLVLLQASPNRLVGNSGYVVKQPVLQQSAFSLTRDTGNFAGWGPAEIAQRQAALADLAVATWPFKPL